MIKPSDLVNNTFICTIPTIIANTQKKINESYKFCVMFCDILLAQHSLMIMLGSGTYLSTSEESLSRLDSPTVSEKVFPRPPAEFMTV